MGRLAWSGDHRVDPAVPGGLPRPGDRRPRLRGLLALLAGDLRTGWWRTVDRVRDTEDPFLGPWVWELHAVAVVAHARHGRLDLVAEIAGELARTLSAMLTSPAARTPLSVMEFPVCGALLLSAGRP